MSEKKLTKPAKPQAPKGEDAPNPVWFKPLMFGFMILGLVWILTFYISNQYLPLGSVFATSLPALNLGSWNLLIGFGLAMIGFGMSTRWK